MKKILMTLSGILFITIISIAQRADSTGNRSENTNIINDRVEEPSLQNSTDSIEGTPRTEDSLSTGQTPSRPKSDQRLQPQHREPIQRQSQVPMEPQSQPATPNNPVQQNQNQNELNQSTQPTTQPTQTIQPVNPSVQPVSPTAPTTPTGTAPLGSQSPK